MQSSDKTVALITGVSSGIGRTTAELLASRGWRTFGTIRKAAAAPASVEVVTLDVREQASVAACVNTVLAAAGRLDALVNNAGTALYGAAEETSIEEAEALFDTDLFGVMRMTQAVLPTMREQRSGRIVTIGSVAGFVPIPFEAAYSVAKHALEGWMESLAYEVEPFGIHAILVEPGFIRTNIDQHVARAQTVIPAYADDRRRAAIPGHLDASDPCYWLR